MIWPAVSGADVSSWYRISSFFLVSPTGTPPLALTTDLHTSYPSRVRMPSLARLPVSDSDAPSTMVSLLPPPPAASPFDPQPATASADTTMQVRRIVLRMADLRLLDEGRSSR